MVGTVLNKLTFPETFEGAMKADSDALARDSVLRASMVCERHSAAKWSWTTSALNFIAER